MRQRQIYTDREREAERQKNTERDWQREKETERKRRRERKREGRREREVERERTTCITLSYTTASLDSLCGFQALTNTVHTRYPSTVNS